ncbi:MAG: glucose-6-phosphate isomerase, partial [Phycisphaerales bacterium]
MTATPPLDALPAHRHLVAHAARLGRSHLRELFDLDPARAASMCAEAHDVHLDFSKQRIDRAALADLVALLGQSPFARRRAAMFAGERINVTEDRAVLHVALRAPRGAVMRTDGHDVVPDVHA